MISKNSRYKTVETDQFVDTSGQPHNYLKVRFIPTTTAQLTHLVSSGERLDHLAFRYYADAERFWRIGDANQAMWPDDLLSGAGGRLKIPTSS
jgi:nucleoid-associated protein YgaU